MTLEPLISIVLPVYNGQKYLQESIQSVIAQTFPNWELIIVDDCSMDETPAIAKSFVAQDDRIRYLRHKQNKKLPAALNTGFNAAQGNYFTWTSDDNLYRPEALAELLSFLEQHPNVDLVYSDYTLIDDAGSTIGKVSVAERGLLVRKSVVGACFLYREVLHTALNGYDEALFMIEDYDFWLRASMQFNIAPLHQYLYQYRHHAGTLTAQRRQQVMTLRQDLILRHLPDLHWTTSTDRARAYLHLMEIAEELQQPENVRAHRRHAWQENPVVCVRYYVLRYSPPVLRRALTRIYQKVRGIEIR